MFFCVIFLLCSFYPAHAQQQQAAAFKDAEYLALVDAAQKDVTQADWKHIRELYLQSSFYDDAVRHGENGMYHDAGLLAVTAAREHTPEAIAAYRQEARKYAGAYETHNLAWNLFYNKSKQLHPGFIDIRYTNSAINGLLKAIRATGDGHSMTRAFHVASRIEENAVVRVSFKVGSKFQTIETGDGHFYEVHRVVDKGVDAGEMFFNIDLYYNRREPVRKIARRNIPWQAHMNTANNAPWLADADYLNLVDTAMKNPDFSQWDELRALYPRTSFYHAVGGLNIRRFAEDMTSYLRSRMTTEAEEYYLTLYRQHFASTGVHVHARNLCRDLKPDFLKCASEKDIYDKIQQSVRATGDGKTKETAFHAISLEEAAYLADGFFKWWPDYSIQRKDGVSDLKFYEMSREDKPLVVHFRLHPQAQPSDYPDFMPPAIETRMDNGLPPFPLASVEMKNERQKDADKVSFMVMDLDGDGIELDDLKKKEAVWWDIDDDRFSEMVAWPKPDDGFLAIDWDSSGYIDHNNELFGFQGRDGFSILAYRDANHDGKIDRQDPIWPYLQVWQDLNHNGFSEKDELHSLEQKDITAINIGNLRSGGTVTGDAISNSGSYSRKTGKGAGEMQIASVFMDYDDTVSQATLQAPLEPEMFYMPNMRGYGVTKDLRFAMSADRAWSQNLYSQVKAITTTTLEDILKAPKEYEGRINHIIYRWARSDGVNPKSRGPNIDARKLVALEKMSDGKFTQDGADGRENPLFWGAHFLNEAYHTYFNTVYGILTAQLEAGKLFTGDFYYDRHTDTFKGIKGLDTVKIDATARFIEDMQDAEDRVNAWVAVVRMIEYSAVLKELPEVDVSHLDEAIRLSDSSLSLEKVLSFVNVEDVRDLPGHDYATKVLGLSARDGDLTQVIALARQKDISKQIVYSDLATELLKGKTKDEAVAYLQERNFVVAMRSVEGVRKETGPEMPYTEVFQAVYHPTQWEKLRALFTKETFDFNMIMVFLNKGQVEWAYAHMQK